MLRISSSLVLVVAVLGLAACGSSSKSSSTTTATPIPPAARQSSAEAAVCAQARQDLQRLSTVQPAMRRRYFGIEAKRLRALAHRPGRITAPTRSALLKLSSFLQAVANNAPGPPPGTTSSGAELVRACASR
jgi:hypothetical protein